MCKLHLFHLIEPVGVLSDLSGHVVYRCLQPFQLPPGFRVYHAMSAANGREHREGSGSHDGSMAAIAALPASLSSQC